MKQMGCTPEQRAACPLREHFQDCHHKFWPRRWYETETGKAFRNLPENKEILCRNEHNELHRTEMPPRKPPEWYMEARLRLAERAVMENVEFEETA